MASTLCSASPITPAEALAGILRAGNANANSGADQLAVVDLAIAELPGEHRAGHHAGDAADDVVHPLVVRTDTAGYVALFVAALVARNIEFSIGARVNAARRSGRCPRAAGSEPSTARASPAIAVRCRVRGVDPWMAAGDTCHLPA